MSPIHSVLIAGCGYVGSALAARLVDEGSTVWGLKRTPDGLPEGVRTVGADVTAPETLTALPGELDAVIYAVSADDSTDAAYRRAYVDGLRNILDAVGRGDPPRRFVFVSSTGVYGDAGGGWVDETTPPEPDRFSGRRLLEGERLVRDRADHFPGGAVVVRFAGIYGPGRSRLVEQVRRGEARCTEGPPTWTNRIHRNDCAGVLAHLLTLESPEPVYIGVDTEPAERCEVLRWLARRLGAPEPPVVPQGPDRGRRRGTKRCASSLLQASGYHFHYPSYREGYGAILATV